MIQLEYDNVQNLDKLSGWEDVKYKVIKVIENQSSGQENLIEMDNFDYNVWMSKKIDELLNMNVKPNGIYDEEIIREYLIYSSSVKKGKKLFEFFKENTDDEELLKMLLKVLLDENEEYSNDSRYSAARIIPLFSVSLLKKYKKELSHAQNYTITNLKPFPKGIPDWLCN